jgi:hypothetical protein
VPGLPWRILARLLRPGFCCRAPGHLTGNLRYGGASWIRRKLFASEFQLLRLRSQQRRQGCFGGRHFDRSLILLCVRWYPAYNLSLRNLEEMMAERVLRWTTLRSVAGLSVTHPSFWKDLTGERSPSLVNVGVV